MVEQVATASKQAVVVSFINFLRKQSFSEETQEGIDIAIQCLNDAFSISESDMTSASLADLELLVDQKASKSISDSSREEAERHKIKGNEFVAMKKPAEAVECYTKSIELDFTNAVYYSNRAAAYSMLEDHFKALEDAKESCRLNPSYSKAFNRLGKAHLALGEPEEAVSAFEKALELEPNDVNIKSSLETALKVVSGDSGPASPQAVPSSASIPGFGNGFDFNSLLGNPQLMNMAQQMMQSGALNDMMKDPKAQDMMKNMMSNPNLMNQFGAGKR